MGCFWLVKYEKFRRHIQTHTYTHTRTHTHACTRIVARTNTYNTHTRTHSLSLSLSHIYNAISISQIITSFSFYICWVVNWSHTYSSLYNFQKNVKNLPQKYLSQRHVNCSHANFHVIYATSRINLAGRFSLINRKSEPHLS